MATRKALIERKIGSQVHHLLFIVWDKGSNDTFVSGFVHCLSKFAVGQRYCFDVTATLGHLPTRYSDKQR